MNVNETVSKVICYAQFSYQNKQTKIEHIHLILSEEERNWSISNHSLIHLHPLTNWERVEQPNRPNYRIRIHYKRDGT